MKSIKGLIFFILIYIINEYIKKQKPLKLHIKIKIRKNDYR
jgi:hypothetical protein